MRSLLMLVLFWLSIVQVTAKEVAGIEVPERVVREVDQAVLQLNGTGIREKFFFDIYLIALYLQQPQQQVDMLLLNEAPVHIDMTILYSEIGQEKFASGWEEGFTANLSDQQLSEVRERLDQFKGLFGNQSSGDHIELDYIPGLGTRVRIKGQERGVIPGWDFFQALLKVWLGDAPVSRSLKSGLLGQE
ncbi:MAG: chalcone isomerase family protein [Candidatus Thiodiazotropha sp.]